MPHWVEPGALFHIRIRLEREKGQKALTDPALGQTILDSGSAGCQPAAVGSLPTTAQPGCNETSTANQNRAFRQAAEKDTLAACAPQNYERGTQLTAKLNYIRRNPVVAGFCARVEDWPWAIDPFAHKH